MKQKYFIPVFFVFSALILTIACSKDDDTDNNNNNNTTDTLAQYLTPISGNQQRQGDAVAGRQYLIYGDYIDNGIPYDLYMSATQLGFSLGSGDNSNLLQREGDNANVSYDYTAATAPNGIRIVAPNCLQCHAQMLNGQLIMGLGNATADFTTDASTLIPAIDLFMNTQGYGEGTPQWEAYYSFRRASLAIGPRIIQKVKGLNSANNLAAVLAAHRNPNTLAWYDEPQLPYPQNVVPVDVPPWWRLRKRNSMFYNDLGHGDYAKISMASSMLTIVDTAKAKQVNEHFADVIAYLNTLEPPAYPQNINATLAEQGKQLYTSNCARCHGTYGSSETYPNLLVDLDFIGTDPMLASETSLLEQFTTWYNQSWFNREPYPAYLEEGNGYVAPPLDGIWCTAPFLHNGSVPTLDDLLNSAQRPTYWKRKLADNGLFDTDDFDYTKVGWNYTVPTAGNGDPNIYDSTLPGYSNQGHTFGDKFTPAERAAVIEYLKTL